MTLLAVVAGAVRSPLTHATVLALNDDGRVQVRGVITRPLRVADVADVDFLISAGHIHYIGREVRDAPRLGTVGLHPSLLPRYRGSHPLWWVLRNGEREAGLTLYRLGAGIDSGPVLDQTSVRVEPADTWGRLYGRVVAEAGPILGRFVDTLVSHGAIPEGTRQDESQATTFKAPTPAEMHVWRLRFRIRRAAQSLRRH